MIKVRVMMLLLMITIIMTSCNVVDDQEANTNKEIINIEKEVEIIELDQNGNSTVDKDATDIGTSEGSEVKQKEVGEVALSINDTMDDDATQKEHAKEKNIEGLELYKMGKYEEALEKFEEASNLDEMYFYGHFNYACTLGVLMKNDYPMWYEYKEIMIDYLVKAIKADPSMVSKILNDQDLDPIRQEFRYLTEVLGYSTETAEGTEAILAQASWYIQGMGVLQVIGGLDFSDGKFNMWFQNMEDFNNGKYDSLIQVSGTYVLVNNHITLILDQPMLRRRSLGDIYDNYNEIDEAIELTGIVTEEGIIEIDQFDYDIHSWYDEFSA